jgi:hypothetical protein
MSGTVPTLARNSIQGMRYIGGARGYRPVYAVNFAGAGLPPNEIVVKGEKTRDPNACASIKWGSKLMKNAASPDVNVKILTQPEIIELRRAHRQYLAGDQEFQVYIDFGEQVVWVRMPYVDGLSDSDIHGRGRAGADALYAKMTNASFWDQLGRVLAVDLFIGNFDRFDGTGTLINDGNIFFKDLGGGAFQVVGTDFFAAQFASGEANLNAMEDPIDGSFDYLRILIDPARRRAYAAKAVDQLRLALLKENPAGIYDLYGFTGRLDAAIDQGAQAIHAYLDGKALQYPRHGHGAPRMVLGGPRGAAAAAAAAAPPVAAPRWLPEPGAGARNNNRAVPSDVIPEGIRQRMRFLGW